MTGRKRKQILLAALDVAFLYVSLFIALTLRGGEFPGTREWAVHVSVFRIIFAGWVVCYYTAGLYSLAVIYDHATMAKRLIAASVVAAAGTVGFFYIFKAPGITPKTVLVLFALAATFSVYFIRRSYIKVMTKLVHKRGIAFVGTLCHSAIEIIKAPKALERLGFEAKLMLGKDSFEGDVAPGIRSSTDCNELAHAVQSGDISLIVIGEEHSVDPAVRRLLFDLLETGASCMNLFDFYELVFRKTPLEDIDETWFLKNINLAAKRPYITAKRLIDILLSFLLLAITVPLWPFVAVAIRVSSSGPVFFGQIRLGRLSKPFRIIKFRTMRTENNHQHPTAQNDSRITSVGNFLRKTRIDELPQLLNVIRGDMSFVGPRPERPDLAEELERNIPYYRQRLLVKPGLTGWDQVSGEYHSPSTEDTFKKLQSDLYYVKNLSLSLDVSIFFKTILTVLKGSGR